MSIKVQKKYYIYVCPQCGTELRNGACDKCSMCNERVVGVRKDIVEWVEISDRRAMVFESTGGKCYYCGKPIEITRFQIDHKVPKSRGGGDELDNLTASCAGCNNKKGAKTDGEFSE